MRSKLIAEIFLALVLLSLCALAYFYTTQVTRLVLLHAEAIKNLSLQNQNLNMRISVLETKRVDRKRRTRSTL